MAKEPEVHMDQMQKAGELDIGVEKEVQNEPTNTDMKKEEAKFDKNAVELDIPLDEFNPKPQQVEDTTVVYVPMKSFGARINQTEHEFHKGVPIRVDRDLANMLLEDDSRGYVRD